VYAVGQWYYVGELGTGRDGLWSHATRASGPAGEAAMVALRWFLQRVQLGWDGSDSGKVPARLWKSIRCARCRRQLTDEESIRRGLGPECWDRAMGGGQ